MAIGGLSDGRKVLIALRSGYRESTESWKGVLRDVRQRGSRTTPTIIPELGTGEGLQQAAELIEEDWERMVSYYGYPRAHWRHLWTTNVIESPFAALRLRTDAAIRINEYQERDAARLVYTPIDRTSASAQ